MLGRDEHLLAVRIFKRNVLEVSGPALGVKPAGPRDGRRVSNAPQRQIGELNVVFRKARLFRY